MNIGFMATYPARALQCKIALDSVAAQLDKIVLVANEYGDVGTQADGMPVTAGNRDNLAPSLDIAGSLHGPASGEHRAVAPPAQRSPPSGSKQTAGR